MRERCLTPIVPPKCPDVLPGPSHGLSAPSAAADKRPEPPLRVSSNNSHQCLDPSSRHVSADVGAFADAAKIKGTPSPVADGRTKPGRTPSRLTQPPSRPDTVAENVPLSCSTPAIRSSSLDWGTKPYAFHGVDAKRLLYAPRVLDGSEDFSPPALTPDTSPWKSSPSPSTPINPLAFSQAPLNDEIQLQSEDETPDPFVDAACKPQKSEVKKAVFGTEIPIELRARPIARLRATQRPLRHESLAASPTKTPDRFITPRADPGDRRIKLEVGTPPRSLSRVERAFRCQAHSLDPFSSSSSSRAPQHSPTRPDSRLEAARSVFSMGRTAFQRAGLWPEAANIRSPSSGEHSVMTNVSGPSPAALTAESRLRRRPQRPIAPVYSSHFWDGLSSGDARAMHEKRLAMAIDVDCSQRILGNPSNVLNMTGPPTQYGNGSRQDVLLAWENNEWALRGSSRILEAPNLRDDFYCSVLAYSRTADRLAVGLGDRLYLWSEDGGVVSPPRLVEPAFPRPTYLTSLSFSSAPNGRSILAIGRANGYVNMFSPTESGAHQLSIPGPNAAVHVSFSPVPFFRASQRHPNISTKQELLLIGDDTGVVQIWAIDWPTPQERDLFDFPGGCVLLSRIVIHAQQICGIAWSPDGKYFATGGNDNLCCLFETKKVIDMSQSTIIVRANGAKHLWQLTAAVKAIAFCPWQRGLLAVGGGSNDRALHFYHSLTGSTLAVIDCAAQVTSLVWSQTRREIAATLGFSQPEHPYRIVVYGWPSCQQIVAIPWADEMRALYAISYPGGKASGSGKRSAGSRRERLAAQKRRRTNPDGSIVVASSDGSIKFHEIWADARRCRPRQRLSSAGGHGLLGGSEILESIHGIDKEDTTVIR